MLKYDEMKKNSKYNANVIRNIQFITSKIIVLSILYLIPLLTDLIIMALDLKFWNWMLGDLDCVISGFIIWFMLEHNNDKYKKMCCCWYVVGSDKQHKDKQYKNRQRIPNKEEEDMELDAINCTNITSVTC